MNTPEAVLAADALVLPGVGAFRDGMAGLARLGLIEASQKKTAEGTPLLGICLGMQMMFEWSEENGHYEGLGLFSGGITRLAAPGLKVPHMGWNTLHTRACPLFDAGEDPCVYFVHSYCAAQVNDDTAATCDYGQTFTAAVCRGNVMATQFHPEKSGEAGLRMLRRFALWQGGEATSC